MAKRSFWLLSWEPWTFLWSRPAAAPSYLTQFSTFWWSSLPFSHLIDTDYLQQMGFGGYNFDVLHSVLLHPPIPFHGPLWWICFEVRGSVPFPFWSSGSSSHSTQEGFIPNTFWFSIKKGGWKPVLYLRMLNTFVMVQKFKIVTLFFL